MSDTSIPNEPNVAPVPPKAKQDKKSKRGRRLIMIIIIILLLGLAAITVLLLNLVAPRDGVASSDETNGIEWVKSIYGWGSTADTQLLAPQEVNIDADGIIWVSDQKYTDRVIAFTPEGKLQRTVGENAKEKIITIGPTVKGVEDRLFIGESSMDRMRVFDTADQELGAFSIPNPIDLAAKDDKLVVGSIAGFAILNAQNGEPLKIVGERGKGENQFDSVNGVAIGEDGRIYVTDAFNNRLSAYDAEGERLWIVETGAPGNQVNLSGGGAMAASTETSAPARLQLPSDITIDGRGRLVVVDALDFSVSVFDPDNGEFLAKYGDYGNQDGLFVYPSSISYDPQRDWFAVADAGNSRVQIVRIPDSSAEFDAAAVARRTLAGPLRACLFPLALLLLLLVAYIWRSRQKKKQERLAAQNAAAQDMTEPLTESPVS